MPALNNLFSPSSSSSSCSSSSPSSFSSSPSSRVSPCGSNDTNFFKNSGGCGSEWSKRRLTRLRKLRHLTDDDLGYDQFRSPPVSPDSGSRSPVNLGHWSAVAVPQPLPLPESNGLFRQISDQSNSRWQREGPSRGDGDGRDRISCSNPSSPVAGSHFCHQSTRKTTHHAASKSSISPTYRHRGFPQALNVEGVHHNFRMSAPVRSAPTSGFSSPALSPQRFSSVDVFNSPFAIPKESRVLSAVEGPVCDKFAGSPSKVCSAKYNPDHSPIHSPKLQSACQNTRNPNGVVASHSHHKSLSEISAGLPEGGSHANLHPLPLPPGGPKPSQSTITRCITEKHDISLMKSPWIKGKLIGRGTYGSVFEAINRETGAMCAMKEVDIIGDDPKSAECIKQLEQEIKVLQHLKHPNIVQYYGCEVVGDRFCIYLEYVHPGSINKYVREHFGAVSESVVRNFSRHILSGLAFLHSTNTIHRDIKGANLLVDASGVVKLADFGLAKHLAGTVTDLSLKGSPHWMAPEVLQAVMRKDSNSQLAYAVDVWSVGCTVIEMLNGHPPWSEFNGVQAMFNVLNRSPPIPETLSPEGKDFLRLCFQRNPADRPSAAWLLEHHRFLRSLHDQDVLIPMQEFSGMKLTEASHSPRDRTNNGKCSVPISSAACVRQSLSNGETSPKFSPEGSDNGVAPRHSTSPKFYPEGSDNGVAPRHSPRSTLEALPCVYSPEVNCRSNFIGPSTSSPNNLHFAAGINNRYNSSRSPRREIPHL